jgi:hypothetical protein
VTTRKRQVAVSDEPATAGGVGAAAASARGRVEVVHGDTLELRDRVAATLVELATTLERTAGIAERIAERAAELGRSDLAASEREAARRARKVAKRARGVARPLRRHGRL